LRRREVAASSRYVHDHAIELDRDACTAGETVNGTLSRVLGDACVTLVRLETHAGTRLRFIVAEAALPQPDGGFALAVPDRALPSVTGERCVLLYAAVANHGRDTACAGLVVRASARPHVDTGSRVSDRLLRTWDARHFHIELASAELRGGGSVSARVHRHGQWPAGSVTATARCIECWRCPVYGPYPAPVWDAHPLWQMHKTLQLDPDAHWTPFDFELPNGLPPAVEGRTIAWRYELVVSRTAPHRRTETAALTPLLYEEAGDLGRDPHRV
jgi:hypothetical protein